jgi:ADP-ribosyl-[dinitrogen reductase] hydrolase
LLGLACGDALGGPVEFVSRGEIARRYPHGLRDFVGGGWLHLSPGEITDDTQMTLALARSLSHGGDLDMEEVAARFLAWFESKPKDVGRTTAAALENLARGIPWQEAGERVQQAAGPRGAAGNGSVMRCAPVALRYRTKSAALRNASLDTARVTHADPRCTWGAVAINQAIVHLLTGGSRADVCNAAVDGIDRDDVRDSVLSAASRPADQVRSGGYVLDTIGAALWCLINRDEFEEMVVAAVGFGDDADTTGAVAGALAGACYGAGAIPARWLDLLQPRAELLDLADRLLAVSQSS